MPNHDGPAVPIDINKTLQQAVEHHRANRLHDAEQMYRAILKDHAHHPDANHNMGLLAVQGNQPEAALVYFKTALDANPQQGQFWLSYIDALIKACQLDQAWHVLQQAHQRGLRGPAVENLAQRLSSMPPVQQNSSQLRKKGLHPASGRKHQKKKNSITEQSHNLETAIREYQSGNFHEAKKQLYNILKINKNSINALWHLSIVYQYIGNIDEAISTVKKCFAIDKNFFNGYNSLGLFYYEKKEMLKASECFLKAIELNPNFAEAVNNLGLVLYNQGLLEQAKHNFEKATAIEPKFSEAYNHLGLVLKELGRLPEAEACYRQALSFKPNYAEAYNNLGILLGDIGQLTEAEACYRQALSFKPNYAEAYNNLGILLSDIGRLTEAEACYRQALSLKPNCAEAHNNLGVLLGRQGQLTEAEACYRQALSFKPDYAEFQTNLLFSYNYNQNRSAEECLTEALSYGASCRARAQPFTDWTALSREPLPLRVGLVSGDLRRHPVGYFLEGVLSHLKNRNQIELLAYVTQPLEDDLTSRLKSCCTTWRSLVGLNDAEAARCIYDDGVHILVDLAGHTEKNRLPVFARKPAPVQVSWLGYFATTGLAQMDYLLADRAGVPLDQQHYFSEQIWYLPETRLCFTPPDIELPIAPLPALYQGHITFGCFQNLGKLNDAVLALWSKILRALPNAILRIQNKGLNDAAVGNHLLNRMKSQEINTGQVILHGGVSRAAYLAAHAEVDLILDTFPYPGGTTTCEALWMGVPTLTLEGNTLLGRQGASLLVAAGLPEWVARSQEEYIAKAVASAQNVPKLARLREGLRDRVGQSPLFDAARFASNLEAELLTMWRCWLEKRSR